MTDDTTGFAEEGIAIIGLALRGPGAHTAAELWRNVCEGREAIRVLSDEQLLAAGVRRDDFERPDYVRARGVLEGAELFDAGFFGFTPREARLMDPQHRAFLECAWEALEDAACDPSRYQGRIGVFAGAGQSGYTLNLLANHDVTAENYLGLTLGSMPDYLTTQLSYRLNLRGPSIGVQTACSTSLVATHLACLHLLAGQCEMALAGGATIHAQQHTGYVWAEGGTLSPDGHCRPFDASGRGTGVGCGVGVVVLKRLDDAIRDGDCIRAVIRGSAVNNDGSLKVGFTAPSVDGQAAVIATAHAMAEVPPATIGYVEAHGTGTVIGDPIEIAALTKAFRRKTTAEAFCALGSVKATVGHLDTAAGAAGLIKAVFAVEQGVIPPATNYAQPNPRIAFAGSPFYVPTQRSAWQTTGHPRRAGVSSFGIGGTNAHVVLEQARPRSRTVRQDAPTLLVVSARSQPALDEAALRLAEHLERHPEAALADVALTLHLGRKRFRMRRAAVVRDRDAAIAALRGPATLFADDDRLDRPVALVFPGQGSHHVNMARELYDGEPRFRAAFDACSDHLKTRLGIDIPRLLYPPTGGDPGGSAGELVATLVAQPVVFAVGFALAELLEHWGVQPEVFGGHSLGEYVAACRAGVFDLPAALDLVALRAELMQRLPVGAMTSIPAPAATVTPLLGAHLSIAAINGPARCVASGPHEEIARLEAQLARMSVVARRLRTSHAFHSAMMDPVMGELRRYLRTVALRPPRRRLLSNLSGTLAGGEVAEPEYWVRHLRETVRFDDNLATLLAQRDLIVVEAGGGQLRSAAIRHPAYRPDHAAVSALPAPGASARSDEAFLHMLGQLWLGGVALDPAKVNGGARVPLPTYPFERERYWLDLPADRAPRPSAGDGARPGPGVAVGMSCSGPAPGAMSPRPASVTAFVAPRDDLEAQIGAIFGECLGYANLGVHDDFFALGGDSLVAMQLVSRVRDQLSVALPLEVLFANPTVHGVRSAVAALREAPGANRRDLPPPAPAAVTPGEATTLPLSYAQERLWFLERLVPGTSVYHLPQCLWLRGPLDVAALTRAFVETCARHDALRTHFVEREGHVVQVIEAAVPFSLRRIDQMACPEQARDRVAHEVARAEAFAPFDLGTGPLFRVSLAQFGEELHLLVLTLHHLIADGWSMSVLRDHVMRRYAAFRAGRPSPEIAAGTPYGEYVRRQVLESDPSHEAHLAYWRDRLAGARPLELSADHPRPAMFSSRGATHTQRLPSEVIRTLQGWAGSHGATLQMALQTAFAALLARYADTEDVVIGSPFAGRDRLEFEQTIGLFVQTVVLRLDCAGNPDLGELLRRVKTVMLEAQVHKDVPFEKVVKLHEPARDLSRAPLFQVMFAYERDLITEAFSEVSITPVEVAGDSAQFDLTLAIARDREGWMAKWEFSTDLFEPETIELVSARFVVVLRTMAADPSLRLQDISLMLPEEHDFVLSSARGPDATPATAGTVLARIDAQVAKYPDAPAILGTGGPLSYRELDRRATELAQRLQEEAGAGSGLVAVYLEPSPEWAIALLGVLKTGAGFLPLDTTWPAARVAAVLRQANARTVIGVAAAPCVLPGVCFVAMDRLAGRGVVRAPRHLDPDSVAYAVFTSGSTGAPKGVVISHANLHHHAVTIGKAYQLRQGDRVLQFASPVFDVALEELFPTLAAGATLVMGPPAQQRSIPDLVRMLIEQEITVVNLPSHYWHEWVEELRRGDASAVPATLRLVIAGSQAASPAALADWRRHVRSGVRWLNAYGVTEATITSTLHEPDAEVGPGRASRVPIGRPIDGVDAHVLDRRMRSMPVGMIGELFLGGAGVGQGYLASAAATAARFVPDPFSRRAGMRLYRTGDRARRRRDGSLELLGRMDRQVKVRGFRIEANEIELALARVPGIAEAAVVVRELRAESTLCAFFAPVAEGSIQRDDVEAALAAQLPRYMLPSQYVELAELPRLASGKIDYPALEGYSLPGAGRARVAPRTPAEQALAEIWRQILQTDDFGIRDSFFALGGDSMAVLRLVARTGDAGLSLRVRDVFEHQTIEALARIAVPRVAAAPALAADNDEVPATPAHLHFLATITTDPQHWNRALLLVPDERLDVEMLRQAVHDLHRRHGSLRLRFELRSAAWRASLADPAIAPAFDAVTLPGGEDGRRLLEDTAASLQAGFDLERGPLFRVAYFQAPESEGDRLLVIAHHLVADTLSWPILLDDLRSIYGQLVRGAARPGPVGTSFEAWAQRIARYASDGRSLTTLGTWCRELEGLPSAMPVDHPGEAGAASAVASERAASWVTRQLPDAATRTLVRTLPERSCVSTEAVVLLSLAGVLTEWMGLPSVLIDVGRHGRAGDDDLDLSRTVGCLALDCPVRIARPSNRWLDEAAALSERLRDATGRALDFGILRYLTPDRGARAAVQRLPVPVVSFDYLGVGARAAGDGFRVAEESVGPLRSPRGRRTHLLQIVALVEAGTLEIRWRYGEDTHRRATIEALADRHLAALHLATALTASAS